MKYGLLFIIYCFMNLMSCKCFMPMVSNLFKMRLSDLELLDELYSLTSHRNANTIVV